MRSADSGRVDALAPAQVAARIEAAGVAKVRQPRLQTMVLAVVAGVFIGLGALNFVLVHADTGLGPAARQMLGGIAFSLGLMLVVVAGGELFTGNNLVVMAWADRRITAIELLRHWGIVLVGNAAGALALAWAVHASGHTRMLSGLLAQDYLRIAQGKLALPFAEALLRGVLCNLLVCAAIWMVSAGRSLTDRVLAIVFPISAFVAAGFEHSIANFYLLAMGWLIAAEASGAADIGGTAGASSLPGALGATAIDLPGVLGNLLPVLLGNLFGGAVLVGLVYHLAYRWPANSRVAPGKAAGLRVSGPSATATALPPPAPAAPPAPPSQS